jgi:branched-chain amino acid aminotransferase
VSVWLAAGTPAAAALAADRGLLLGDGLFETVLVEQGRAALLARHLARLAASAAQLGFELPADAGDAVLGALPGLCADEGRPARAALRVVLTRGAWCGLEPGPGAPPTLLCVLRALPAAGVPAPPVAAVVVGAPRIDPRSPLAGHKTLSALPFVEARRRARAAGAERALLTTVDGDVAEADAANLFAVVGGRVVTPALDRGVLPGITRARCLAALRAAGHAADERRLAVDELLAADEAFLTSSLDGVRPLASVDSVALRAPGRFAGWLADCLRQGEPPGLLSSVPSRRA